MMDDGNYDRTVNAAFLALLVLLTSVSLAGCLEDDGNGGPSVEVPEDRRDARVEIGGEVATALNLSLQELVDRGLKDFEATFVNSVGTTYTSNYTGVPLKGLLEDASPDLGADLVDIVASDGYRAVLFLSSVTDTTYLAVKENDDWLDLLDSGAIMLVDTDLPAMYWVRDVMSIDVRTSTPLEVLGLANVTDVLTAGWVHDHADTEVSWQEGSKTRTYRGVGIPDVLEAIDSDDLFGTMLTFKDSLDASTSVHVLDAKGMGGALVVDSRGGYVYVQEDSDLVVKGVVSLEVSGGVRVWEEVGDPGFFTLEDLKGLPPRDIEVDGRTYRGAALEALVAEAGPDATADAIQIFAGDGYPAVLPLANLTTVVLAYEVDGEPLEPGLGPFKIVDSARPKNFWVSWVTQILVFTSQPLPVTGLVNVTDAITIPSVDRETDTTVSYNDGNRDRTYPGVTWELFLDLCDYDASQATVMNVTRVGGAMFTWDIADLLAGPSGGLVVDSRGGFVAVIGEPGEVVLDVTGIEVG